MSRELRMPPDAPLEAPPAPSPGAAGTRPNGRDVALIFAAVLAIGLVCLFGVTAVIVVGTTYLSWPDPMRSPTGAHAIVLPIIAAAVLGGVYGVGNRWRGVGWTAIGVRPAHWRWLVLAVLLGVALEVVSGLVDSAIGGPLKGVMLNTFAPDAFSWWWLAVMILFGVILGPITEEILFRGVLYTWLRDKWGVATGVVVSSLAFGAMHVEPAWIVLASLLGAAFALLYQVSRSIWPPIVMHVVHNGTAIVLVALVL